MDEFLNFSIETGVTVLASWSLLSGWMLWRQRRKIEELTETLARAVEALEDADLKD